MERRILFDAFERVFEEKLSNDISREDTFKEATAEYEKNFGFHPYKNVESYMACRSRYKKRKARR